LSDLAKLGNIWEQLTFKLIDGLLCAVALACVYTSSVIVMCEWPSCACAMRRGVPCSCSSVPCVCRSVCQLIGASSACAHAGCNCRLRRLFEASGVPLNVQNTSSSADVWLERERCVSNARTIAEGSGSSRRLALVFGGPYPGLRVQARRQSRVAALRSFRGRTV
jgi:hypothetical protein